MQKVRGNYVLGFDGGGSKTECVVMDPAKTIRGRGRGGPSNPSRIGFPAAFAGTRAAAEAALRDAGICKDQVTAICAGLAGVGQTGAAQRMDALLRQEFPERALRVCTDLDLALEAAGQAPVVVLIAGTGSAAVGRNSRGALARAGGRGPLHGDEGSAFDVGRRAGDAAQRQSLEGGASTGLGEEILRELSMASWQKFEALAESAPDEVYPRIFPVVARWADRGDAGMRLLLQNAADQLARLVHEVVFELELQETSVRVVPAGGMIRGSVYLAEQLRFSVERAVPLAELSTAIMTAAEAAGRIALRMLDNE